MHKETQIRDLTRKFNLSTPVGKRIKSNEATKDKRQKKQALFNILDLGKFYSGKNLFELVKWKEGFETKLQVLELPDSDKRAKR